MNLNPILPHGAAYAARCEHQRLSTPAQGRVVRPQRPSLIAHVLHALAAAFDRAPERTMIESAVWRRAPSSGI